MASIDNRGGRWRAQVRRTGHPLQSATFATRGAAETWARRIEREMDQGRATGQGVAVKATLGELIDRYVAETKPAGRNKRAVLASLRAELGGYHLRDLTASVIIAWGRSRSAAGAGPVTISIDLTYLAGVLETARAVWRLHVPREPLADARSALRHLGLVGKSRERTRRPSGPELAAIFAAIERRRLPELPLRDIVEFAIASGMRLGEIVRIRRADLDPGRRVVLVRDRKDPRRKAGNNQLVPLLDVTGYDALAIALRQPASPDGRLFPYRAQSVSRGWQRACAAAGVLDLHFHDLRSEAASRMFESGLPVEVVALCTGHREWRTLQRYARLRAEDVPLRFPAGGRAKPAPPRRDRA
jgi:integrase